MQAVQLAAVLALLVSCASATTGTMCDKWAQCGGKGSMCGQKGYGTCEDAAWSTHTCPSNFECQRQSDYYWQCLPVGSSQPQNAPKDSKHHDTVKGGVLAGWEQCGGTAGVCGIGSYGPCRDDAWSEPVCPSGFECVRDTQYYWQCLPMDRAPPASPAPSEMSGGEEMPNGVVPQWGQCGGQAGTCGADGWGPCEDKVWDSPVCPDGFTCERQSQWYYQCLPDNATDVVSSPRVSGGHQTTVHNGIIIEWGQCGGVAGVCGQDKQGPCQDSAWSSPVCPTDFECVRDTQYYWQCLPKDRSPSPSPSASPAPPMEESSMEETSLEMSSEMSPSGPGGYVPQYGQCGGTSGVCGMPGWGPCEDKTWDSPMCPSGFTCTRQTQYYWQCLPVEQSNGGEMSMEESSGFELSMEESSSEANPSGVVPPWGQCGGKSGVCGQPGWGPCKDAVWDSPVCPPGFSCTRDTKWYYQCLPEEGTQPEKSVQGGNQQYDNRVKNGVLAQWEQCGGTSGVCGNTTAGFGPCQDSAWSSPTCPSSYECRRQSEWYWQCVPVGWSAPSPVSSEASQQYKPVNGMLRGWDQCGGISSMCGQDGWGACVDEAWDKPMCPDGFKCKRDTKWYWQCLPTNTPSPSKTPSPVKSVQQPVNGECPKWAQCGGMGGVCGQSGWGPCEDKTWDSPKCPSGFTCTKDTKWYYQCLPEGTKLSKKHN